MNDNNYKDRVFQGAPDKKENANTLLSQIIYFVSHNKLTPHDTIILNGIIKQLNQRKVGFPRKVLRGMENKFLSIQSNYQRG